MATRRLNFYIERLPEFFRENHFTEEQEMKAKFFSLMESSIVKNDLVQFTNFVPFYFEIIHRVYTFTKQEK
jgi:hypothetical protein